MTSPPQTEPPERRMKEGRISDRNGFDGVTSGKVHMLRKKERDYRKKISADTTMRSAESWQDLIELTGGRIAIHEIEAIQADAQLIHAGFKIVPIEPTEQVLLKAACTRRDWGEMIAAAPDGKEPTNG